MNMVQVDTISLWWKMQNTDSVNVIERVGKQLQASDFRH